MSRRSKRSGKREEGMAMLVVMLILLMVTATATFAVHSTTMDIRSAGNTRLAMQTHNLATASLLAMADYTERQGIQTIMATIARENAGGHKLVLTSVESAVNLAPGKEGSRFSAEDLATGGVNPAPAGLFGPLEGHRPLAFVDVYDTHAFSVPIAGQRADGLSPFRFVRMTFTARARARVPVGTSATTFANSIETASDARAHIVAGPAFF